MSSITENKKQNTKSKRNKSFIVGASIATLIASGSSKPVDTLSSSGDVSGTPTDGDDMVMLGMGTGGSGDVSTGGGDDTIVGSDKDDKVDGGSGDDLIMGGGGSDDLDGGPGLDKFIVVGVVKDGDYTEAQLKDVGGSGLDISDILTPEQLNDHEVSDLADGESIDGGADGAILYTFGEVDFTNVSLDNITEIYVDGAVAFDADALKTLIETGGLVKLSGQGVVKATDGVLDLDGVEIAPEIEIQDADGNVIVPKVDTANSVGTAVSMAENSYEVGSFLVTDESAVGAVTYSLSGTDADLFNIDAETGRVSFKVQPDFETAKDDGADNVYDIVVTATDEHQKSVSQDIAVTVTDDNDAPIFGKSGTYSTHTGEGTTPVGQVTAVDLDGDDFSFSLFNDDAELFTIDDDGYIRFKIQPDFEAPRDLNGDNIYIFYIKATDSLGHVGQSRFITTVDNTADEPIVVANNVSAKKGFEFLVNSETSNSQSDPAITYLSDGKYVVVWSTVVDHSIKLQKYNADGTTDGTERFISSGVAGTKNEVDVAASVSGTFVATWTDHSSSADGDGTAIKARIFNIFGNGITGTDFQVNTDTTGDQSGSKIVTLNTGGFVIAWTTASDATDGSGTAIKMQSYTFDGIKIGGEKLVNSTFADDQHRLSMAALDGGGFVIGWQTDNSAQDGTGSAIKFQIFDNAGDAVGFEQLANTQGAADQVFPSVAALKNGGFVMVWSTNDSSQDSDGLAVKGQIFDKDGAKQGDEFLVNTTSDGNQQNTEVEALSDGGFIVSWTTPDSSGSPYADLAAQEFNADGDKIGNEFLINQEQANTQNSQAIAANTTGGYTAVWTNLDGIQDGSGSAIKSQHFENSPILKFAGGSAHDLNIFGELTEGQSGQFLGNIIIEDVPEGVSSNVGSDYNGAWTVSPFLLPNLQIIFADGFNGAFDLTVHQASAGTGEFGMSTVKVPIHVGNTLNGGAGTQIFSATDGFDHIDGGTGSDLVKFSGEKADYSFAIKGNDLQITHTASGETNIDLLHAVEKIQFGGNGLELLTALDDGGAIGGLSGAEFDTWLASSYDYEF